MSCERCLAFICALDKTVLALNLRSVSARSQVIPEPKSENIAIHLRRSPGARLRMYTIEIFPTLIEFTVSKNVDLDILVRMYFTTGRNLRSLKGVTNN